MNAEALLPAVIELRQYTLHAGRRDELISLFEREFIEPQQACGISLLGQFRDRDDANRFVWLRGFASMPARAQALADFYGGPVWQAHRQAANATMIDSDNVLLLRPALALPPPPVPVRRAGGAEVLGLVWPLRQAADDDLRKALNRQLLPALAAQGAAPLACLETEPTPNNFPRLPVREHEPVLVCLAAWPDGGQAPDLAALDHLLAPWRQAAPQVLRLQPTARSAWR